MRLSRLPLILLAVPLFASSVHIYVANSDDNKVTIIDPATDTVAGEIGVSPNPHGIVASPDGARFYISSESKDVLDVVDRKTRKIIRSVPLGTRPNNVAITADGKRVYVCIRGMSQVDIVDTASLEKIKSVPVGKGPHNVDGRQQANRDQREKRGAGIRHTARRRPAAAHDRCKSRSFDPAFVRAALEFARLCDRGLCVAQRDRQGDAARCAAWSATVDSGHVFAWNRDRSGS
jgi:YVTN family beta-propeller protein